MRHEKAQTGYSIDVFHQRNLRKILGITWKDNITNDEVLQRTGQRSLQDIVAERRFRFANPFTSGAPSTLRHGLHARGGQEKERKMKEDMVDNIQRGLTTTRNQPV